MQEAFLTAMMVAAVSAFSMMMTAGSILSMMVTASLAFLVMVMIAGELGIALQFAFQIISGGLDHIALHAADEFDSLLFQQILSTGTDSSAEQDLDAEIFQESGESAVTVFSGRDRFHSVDSSVHDFKDREFGGFSEMLKHLTVFRCDCQFEFRHPKTPFVRFVRGEAHVRLFRETGYNIN